MDYNKLNLFELIELRFFYIESGYSFSQLKDIETSILFRFESQELYFNF